LPRAIKLTRDRKMKIRARWKENPKMQSLEKWEQYFRLILSQGFLMGNNNRGWRADFDFLVSSEKKFVKIIEGSYKLD
jgi:hypothetical protein